jgi:hypothetical protein
MTKAPQVCEFNIRNNGGKVQIVLSTSARQWQDTLETISPHGSEVRHIYALQCHGARIEFLMRLESDKFMI